MNDKRSYIEVRELINKYRDGDLEAREELIVAYMDRAEKIAQSYINFGVEEEDLIQSAYEGLIEGVDECIKSDRLNPSMFIARSVELCVKKEIMRRILPNNKNGIPRYVRPDILAFYEQLENDGYSDQKIIDIISFQFNVSKGFVEDFIRAIEYPLSYDALSIEEKLDIRGSIVDAEREVLEQEVLEEVEALKNCNRLGITDKRYLELLLQQNEITLKEAATYLKRSVARAYQSKEKIKKRLGLKAKLYTGNLSDFQMRNQEKQYVMRMKKSRTFNKNRV